MRYLAIDLGDKRTGLAVGDVVTMICAPVGVLDVPISRRDGQDLLAAITKAIGEHGPGALVVGLPLNMDGTEGPRAKLVRAFAARIAAACPLPVHFADERLSTARADWALARTGLTHGQKKTRRDAVAAAAILSDFLAGLKGSAQGDSPQSAGGPGAR